MGHTRFLSEMVVKFVFWGEKGGKDISGGQNVQDTQGEM